MSFRILPPDPVPENSGVGFFGSVALISVAFIAAMIMLCSGFMGPSLQRMGFMLAAVIFGPFVLFFLVMLRRGRKARGD